MPHLLVTVLTYTLLPIAATILGGAVAAFRPPSPRVRSYAQHIAAGTIFAALAVELLPDVIHGRRPLAAAVGFAAGTGVLLALRHFSERGEPSERGETTAGGDERSAAGLLAAVGVDIAIDGLVIGLGFAAGAKQGALITIALSLELLFLGAGVAASLRGDSTEGPPPKRILTIVATLAGVLAVGAAAGGLLAGALSGAALEAVLAFGCAALLYLVTEELLVEAHEVPETPFTTATFFIGFLFVLILDMVN